MGHSHEDIDGAFGAIAHDIYLTEFDDADGVVDVLNKPGGKKNSYAYKLDEVALWKNWVAQCKTTFKGLRFVGYVKFCRREDMLPEDSCEVQEIAETQQSQHGGDIFVVAKRFQSDPEPFAIVCVMSERRAREIEHCIAEPSGLATRREINEKLRKSILKQAPLCLRSGDISQDSYSYLTNWVQGTLQRKPRPARYSILSSRWQRFPALNYAPVLPVRARVINLQPPAHLISDSLPALEDNQADSNDEVDAVPIAWG